VPEEVLQVQRQVEEQREHRARDPERRQLDAGEGRPLEEAEREHGLRHATLDRQERHKQQRRCREETDDEAAAPALLVAANQREHEQEQRARERDQTRPVHARGVRITRLADPQVRDRDRRNADRHVQEEDPLPPERVNDQSAHERTEGDRQSDSRAVDAHRHAALAAGGELLRDQGERHREHHRTADALSASSDVQEGRISRESRDQRGDREDRQPDREHAPAPEPVRKRARSQHDRGQSKGVGVHDPLKVGEGRVEVLLDGGKGGVHHRDVEEQHEGGNGDDAERPPLGCRLRGHVKSGLLS
jgi:hypothetical protein